MRKSNSKIVVVSGGFDPLHIGHVKYFKAAKQLARENGRVILILNTDKFLIKKKGYVFMPYSERKEILQSLRYIDKVVRCRDEDQTVCKTLKSIEPDIFAKGGDRTLGNIPERGVCERLGIKMRFGVGGGKMQSSSWLIKKILDDYERKK